jgi:hypothetical protein
MNENENSFDALCQLLKLKRHETPPPGYFNNFSSQVIACIRARETQAGKTTAEEHFSEAPWLLKLLQAFELKPAFAGAFASALCLVLLFGIVYAERPDSTPQPLLQNSNPAAVSFAAITPATVPISVDNTAIIASTNPAASLQPVASLFGSQNPFAQQVSFSPSGN